jgi:hypothetical protein
MYFVCVWHRTCGLVGFKSAIRGRADSVRKVGRPQSSRPSCAMRSPDEQQMERRPIHRESTSWLGPSGLPIYILSSITSGSLKSMMPIDIRPGRYSYAEAQAEIGGSHERRPKRIGALKETRRLREGGGTKLE